MERPLPLAEGDGQTGKRDIAFGARIAQPMCFAGQVGSHRRKQVGLVEFEGLAEFEFDGAASLIAGQSELKNGGGLAVKVAALGSRDQDKSGLRGGGLNGRS